MKESSRVPTLTFKLLFEDWQDYDVSEYYFCCLLGLIEYDESFDAFRKNKGVFCTGNRLSDAIYGILENLVALNILEKNENSEFRCDRRNLSPQEIAYQQ